MLLALVSNAQNYNNFVLATNVVPVMTTNTVISSNLYCISRNGTLWVTVAPITNNAASTPGLGAFAFALGGLQTSQVGANTQVNYFGTGGTNVTTNTYPNGVSAVLLTTNAYTSPYNVLTITANGTNPVTGYINFDASPFGSVAVLNMQNQCTNLIMTNITANITWR